MTAEQIEALTGRELDAAVAEQVMGWQRGKPGVNGGMWVNAAGEEVAWIDAGPLGDAYFHPSGNGHDMLAVLARLHELGWSWTLRSHGRWGDVHPMATVCDTKQGTPWRLEEASGETLPIAVCRAALMAVQGKEAVP